MQAENLLPDELVDVEIDSDCRDNLGKFRNETSVETPEAFPRQYFACYCKCGSPNSGDLLSSSQEIKREHKYRCDSSCDSSTTECG